jgi:cell division septum initiation protein DivIVA
MDILILIDRLDQLFYDSKPIPLTDQVRVERQEVYEILDQMRVTLPEEIKQARWIVKERQEMREAGADDAQLQAIARSLEELKRTQRATPPPLTAAAADQVRGIVEAAETSAAEVRDEADREAKRIAEEARRGDLEARRKTAADSAAKVSRAQEATDAMVREAAEMSGEIRRLLDSLREPAEALDRVLGRGASSLRSDFDSLRTRLAEIENGGRAAQGGEAETGVVERDPEFGVEAEPPPPDGAAGTEIETDLLDEGADVSAARLSGAPPLNHVPPRHIQQDQT